MRKLLLCFWAVCLMISFFSVKASESKGLSHTELKILLAKYAPVPLQASIKALPVSEKKALEKMVEAARALDLLYWKQRSKHGLDLLASLEKSNSELEKDQLHYLKINYGPYDKSDGDKAFIGTKSMPSGATFYPEDLTKEEFERYLDKHPEVKEDFQKINTIIKREGDKLVAVPFEEIFHLELTKTANALREASRLTRNVAFKKYLDLRADALLSGTFRNSDFAWIDVRDGFLDIVIGPIEVYDDSLLGLKASYEAMVLVRDVAASEKLKVFEQKMDNLQQNLPVTTDLQPKEKPTATPISIFDVAYAAGASNVGVKTVAASLPNDEVVIKEKGAKKLFYKNIMLAKYEKILLPIAEEMVDPKLLPFITDEAFFNNVLGHELAHTLGLKFVRKEGKDTETAIRIALKDTYSSIEEAKADIVGIYAVSYLTKKGVLTPQQEKQSFATYLAGTFRSIRFGSGDDHARANIIQFNYLRERGAITYDEKTGLFGLDFDKFRASIRSLSEFLLTVEGRGDYESARQTLDRQGRLDKATEDNLKRLDKIPVDIEFIFK
ncbi:MAG: Zn-dependent hydrolase [Blastocatellia bacterium]|nr:Zn-dependent hydrolase [Blastocatellia bacterium]